jgi:hypothetical protein
MFVIIFYRTHLFLTHLFLSFFNSCMLHLFARSMSSLTLCNAQFFILNNTSTEYSLSMSLSAFIHLTFMYACKKQNKAKLVKEMEWERKNDMWIFIIPRIFSHVNCINIFISFFLSLLLRFSRVVINILTHSFCFFYSSTHISK